MEHVRGRDLSRHSSTTCATPSQEALQGSNDCAVGQEPVVGGWRKTTWHVHGRKEMNSPVLEGLNRGERLDGRPQGEPSPSGMVSSTSYSNVTRAGSLVSFKEYKQMAHSNSLPALLEYETLELRVHPPNIKVDNYSDPSNTIITIDSANRPGTLVEVVQNLTELGLVVKKARISSDGGWFVDVFHVTDLMGRKVQDDLQLESIQHMLDVGVSHAEEDGPSENVVEQVHVFEVAGPDKVGLTADLTEVLQDMGFNIIQAAVWTQSLVAAFVFSVQKEWEKTESPRKVLKEVAQRLGTVVREGHSPDALRQRVLVEYETCVKKEQHPERRLHMLLLRVKADPGDPSNSKTAQRTSPLITDIPVISVSDCHQTGYTIVDIQCKDRTSLLFDTVCTLADMEVDVYHATIDSDGPNAMQEYYLRTRQGTPVPPGEAEDLSEHLKAALVRRVHRGLRVDLDADDGLGLVSRVAEAIKREGLNVTAVQVMVEDGIATGSFFVTGKDGADVHVSELSDMCKKLGGRCKLTPCRGPSHTRNPSGSILSSRPVSPAQVSQQHTRASNSDSGVVVSLLKSWSNGWSR